MALLSEERIASLLEPYLADEVVEDRLYADLSRYLDLLMKWNARTNLTAIRETEVIVQRHFGESLFAGIRLGERLGSGATLLDFGSGAGFPGLPIQLLRPDFVVMVAESQNKKAAFLREVVRTLGMETEVWAGRVEGLPEGRRFGAVTLRAVDDMGGAILAARRRVEPGGLMGILGTEEQDGEAVALPMPSHGFLSISRVE